MTKAEAIVLMKQGVRVTHYNFTNNEWMKLGEDGDTIILEDGVKCSQLEFWRWRTDSSWSDGWELFVPTPTKLFFDTEFTGLHKNTTLISIGIISQNGETFYAEFTDYDKTQVNEWIEENVIKNLTLDKDSLGKLFVDDRHWQVRGDKAAVKYYLEDWLKRFEKVEFWSDCLSYDWVLFCDIFENAQSIPENVYYIPFDISTLFKDAGINPDIRREAYVENYHQDFASEYLSAIISDKNKHNALYDAITIKICYEKLSD